MTGLGEVVTYSIELGFESSFALEIERAIDSPPPPKKKH